MAEAFEKKPRVRWPSILRQVAFGFIVGASKTEVGMVVGWSAILPKLQADNSSGFDVGESDVTWLVASPSIAGLVVTLWTGPLMEVIGPSRLLFVLYLPIALLWLLQAFTPYLSVLYLARYLASGTCMVFGSLPATLISELSEPGLRGFLLGFEEALVALGQMAVYVMADLLPWTLATALCAAPFVLLFAAAWFLPESPYWLVRKGREEDAASPSGGFEDEARTSRRSSVRSSPGSRRDSRPRSRTRDVSSVTPGACSATDVDATATLADASSA
ncbi:hypothetical protein C7M84_020032 [Penaeus vannamei]|uniref:Major facilitator superfamily (MFS) profile domain-containing protein n=1 Tax=Penaeus vannamei TaxID=6689 RepID=A0A423SD54_PENVA|nr:hypothetical protein C7M84_020032 [Penaeus vannamei]